VRYDRPKHVECAAQIQIQHVLKRRVVGFRHGFSAGEPANQVRENIDPLETINYLLNSLTSRIRGRHPGRNGREGGVIEIRLLNASGNSNDGRSRVQQSLRHSGPQAAIRAGYQHDFIL
jgi:hypothetical protein